MTLLELQRRMAEDVMRPLSPDFQMQTTTEDGRSIAAIAEGYIKPNERLSSFDRLEIYNRQYWFRVITAVAEDFPALNAVLGSDAFDVLVLAYLRDNPSSSFTLRDLGSRLPEWLQDHAEFTSGNHDLAVDIARLEWAYVEAFDRAAIPPVNGADFAGFDGETRLSLQPHLQLLNLKYPVDELVLAVHRENALSDIMSNAISKRRQTSEADLPELPRQDIYLAVHRYDNSVYYRRIDREAFLLLSSLQSGNSLGSALESAFQDGTYTAEDQTAKIQEYFAHAAELGWFCIATPK
ncbi:Glutamate synthase [NADPH] large chain [Acidisarcina polymorpha]|uniref:Glutamate synthase [NADPH] large chain n=1 Tax=Acidisarcina polymorpha TaxID=2211140 RepID=A0A2Z5G0C6_9BACT|nr:DNA-binding domain-containing protein [Acidisarcina polymorpha]AXC12623.1 Glutamate synthase [NADPH] large chain [Acidisarcina polymorpha]